MMNDLQIPHQEYPEQAPVAAVPDTTTAVAGGAVQDAERSALAVHQDPSLVRPHPNSKVGRGLEWVRPSDLIAAHSARMAGRGLDLQTTLAARVRQLPSRTRSAHQHSQRSVALRGREASVFDAFDVWYTTAAPRQSVQSGTPALGFR